MFSFHYRYESYSTFIRLNFCQIKCLRINTFSIVYIHFHEKRMDDVLKLE